MINSAKICSKCEWYQHGEKPAKFFLNLEKQKANRTLNEDTKDITDLKEINAYIRKFYKNHKRISLNQIRKGTRF